MQIPKGKLKVVVMSDTHDFHHKVNIKELPPADIFIHCGDFTKVSGKEQLIRFRQFLQMLPYKHKVVIAGNHDFGLDKIYHARQSQKAKLETTPDQQISKLKEVCTYLQHQSVQIEGVKIFGSPYSVEFYNWGFMYAEKDADHIWESIPQNVDILVTHGPPYGILDKTTRNNNAGCKSLLKKIEKVKPQFHLFGHIHEAYGREVHDGTTFINASNVNFGYRLFNAPQTFEIQPKGENMLQK